MRDTNRITSKDDVQTHSEGYARSSTPALDIKVYRWPVDADDVAKRFDCSHETAQEALNFQFESAQGQFFEDAQERAREIWGASIKVYTEGRSGGWLIVDGINTDLDTWDAIALAQWRSFARWVDAEIDGLLSEEAIYEDIESNQWHEEGSERFNMCNCADGSVVTVAELKQVASQAQTERLKGITPQEPR